MSTHNPIICAIDTTDMHKAVELCREVESNIGAVKLGLEFYTANGPAGIKAVTSQTKLPIFLDLKFHDIPNTVSKAILATEGLDVFMLTVHTLGGCDMMRAAAEAAKALSEKTGKAPPLVIGVTVLTSMDDQDLDHVGIALPPREQGVKLALLAKECGLDGIVCSPHEITAIRQACGEDFTLVVPGIRPNGSDNGDQKRVQTPADALAGGANYLVIGRPITSSENPAQAAQAICAAL